MVAIGPQIQRQSDFMATQHGLPFPVLTDTNNAVAEQFGLAYTVPEYHRDYYLSILVNIPFVNGEESWRLPMPATYVLDRTRGGCVRRGTCGFSRAARSRKRLIEAARIGSEVVARAYVISCLAAFVRWPAFVSWTAIKAAFKIRTRDLVLGALPGGTLAEERGADADARCAFFDGEAKSPLMPMERTSRLRLG